MMEKSMYSATWHRNEMGYVLFEALIAILLLTTGMLATMQAYRHTVYVAQYRRIYLQPAKALAESIMRRLELEALSGIPDPDLVESGQQGPLRYDVERLPWNTSPTLEQIRVIVRWNDRGKPGQVSLTTLLPAKFVAPAHK